MTINVGIVDRVLRIALGVGLLWLAFLSGSAAFDGAVVKIGTAFVGIVMLTTASLRICPLYTILGFKTCKVA